MLRRGQARRGQHPPELAAVLGQGDGLRLRAEHRNTRILQTLCQPERRLPTQRADDAGHGA